LKNLKYLLMVIMMVALAIVASACKAVDPVQVDEFDRASVVFTVTAQFDGFAYIAKTYTFHVKTFAETRIEGTTHFGSKTGMFGIDVPNTGGQWQDVGRVETDSALNTGTYDVWGEYTMMSIGKTITSPTTQVTVK
jgi:hypothetical protein